MTGDHRDRIAQHDSKDVPRFAPNFTVYVLPSKVVCLYSEDRKFFLHGELYCALASAIGEGRKSFRELVRALEGNFPSNKIHEALKRLVDRRFIIAKPRASADTVAAYWASLGLSPEIDFPSVEFLGNTGAVALPTAFALGVERGHVAAGDKVALLGIGSGLSSIMLGVEW